LQDLRAGTLRSLDREWFNAVVKIAEVRSSQSIVLSFVMRVNQMILILVGGGKVGFGRGRLTILVFHIKAVACLYSSSASLLDTLGETYSEFSTVRGLSTQILRFGKMQIHITPAASA
jgi:hypothetical protein